MASRWAATWTRRRAVRSASASCAVLLAVDEPRVRALFPATRDPLATLTTLEAALGRRPSFEAGADALAEAFEREHGLDLRPGGLSASEAERVATLVTERYASPAWLAASA